MSSYKKLNYCQVSLNFDCVSFCPVGNVGNANTGVTKTIIGWQKTKVTTYLLYSVRGNWNTVKFVFHCS